MYSITSTVTQTTSLMAVPYRAFTGREAVDERRNQTILDSVAGLPNVFPLTTSLDERKVVVAQYLTDPQNVAWEVWRGGDLTGILLMTRIVRGLDALCHLAFFDRRLLDKRQMILNTMGWAFRELDLRRLTLEIPEHLEPLIRFARTKLGFRYEGEHLAAAHPVALKVRDAGVNGEGQWMAHFGSRREMSHWDGAQWRDVVTLVLLREEFEADYGRPD